MKEVKTADIVEEASDALGAPASEEHEDFSPKDFSAEDRARYDQAVKVVDDFIASNPRYKQTEANRELVLEFLADHSLEISPAALALAYERLQDRLDLEPPESEEKPNDLDRIRQASTAQLAMADTEGEPESGEAEPEESEEPKIARGKPVAWRNGRRAGVAA